MARKSFAESLSSTQLLVKALQERGEELPIGVTSELIDKLDKLNKQSVNVNAEQEKLKTQLKEKTAEFNKITKELDETFSLLRKFIKIGVPKELWKEFGIVDKR